MSLQNCPNCGRRLDVKEEVDLKKGLGKCTGCNSFFNLSQAFDHTMKERYFDPTSIKTWRDHRGLNISFEWKTNVFMLIFALFWNFITWVVIGIFVSKGEIGKVINSPVVIILFTHPFIGIVTAWYAIAGLVNSTQIYVDFERIRVQARPLFIPFFNKEIKKNGIEQLFVSTYVAYRQNHSPVYRFRIQVKTIQGIHTLVKGIPDYEKAVTIEKELEDLLGINDKPVEGEYTPL